VSYKVEHFILILPSGVLYREGTFYLVSIEEIITGKRTVWALCNRLFSIRAQEKVS